MYKKKYETTVKCVDWIRKRRESSRRSIGTKCKYDVVDGVHDVWLQNKNILYMYIIYRWNNLMVVHLRSFVLVNYIIVFLFKLFEIYICK